MKPVILLHSLYWSIHTKDESKRGTAFAIIFGMNWLWHCAVTASFGVLFHEWNVTEWQVSWNSFTIFSNVVFVSYSLFYSENKLCSYNPTYHIKCYCCGILDIQFWHGRQNNKISSTKIKTWRFHLWFHSTSVQNKGRNGVDLTLYSQNCENMQVK